MDKGSLELAQLLSREALRVAELEVVLLSEHHRSGARLDAPMFCHGWDVRYRPSMRKQGCAAQGLETHPTRIWVLHLEWFGELGEVG